MLAHSMERGSRALTIGAMGFVCVLIAVLLGASAVFAAEQGDQPHPGLQASALMACVNVVVNGDFEQGVANPEPWVLEGHAYVSDERAHSGYFGVWMGGYKEANDTMYQLVAVPLDADAVTLRYWWNMHSLDDGETPYDHLNVTVRTSDGDLLETLETLDNTYVRNTWTQSTFDLSTYGGSSLRVHFSCSGNEQFITSFFLDDVELEVCSDVETPTPTASPIATATPTFTATPTIELSERRYLPLVWRDASD